MKITWTDKNRKDDPAPETNDIENKLRVLGYYVNRSRVGGIHEAFANLENQYSKATAEYIRDWNSQNERIGGLQKEITELKRQLEKWTKNQKGRRKKNVAIEEVLSLKKEGLSNRKIGEQLNISEGTVRNILKSGL